MRWLCVRIFFFFAESYVFVHFFFIHSTKHHQDRNSLRFPFLTAIEPPTLGLDATRLPQHIEHVLSETSTANRRRKRAEQNRKNIHIFRNWKSLSDNPTKKPLITFNIIYIRTERRTKRGSKCGKTTRFVFTANTAKEYFQRAIAVRYRENLCKSLYFYHPPPPSFCKEMDSSILCRKSASRDRHNRIYESVCRRKIAITNVLLTNIVVAQQQYTL